MEINKRSFTVGEKKYFVVKPDADQLKEAQKRRCKAFKDAVNGGAILQGALAKSLEDQRVWTKDDEAKFDSFTKQIADRIYKIESGGDFTFEEAVKLAKEVRELRAQRQLLTAERDAANANTVESQAENAWFNYLASVCIREGDNTGKPHFKSYDEYIENIGSEVAKEGINTLMLLLYGVESNYQHELPENKFFEKYKLVDSKLRFVNKDNKLVDDKGRLINENGRFVNANNELVDLEGRRVDEKGNFIIAEFKGFKGEPAPTTSPAKVGKQ